MSYDDDDDDDDDDDPHQNQHQTLAEGVKRIPITAKDSAPLHS